MPTFGKIYIRKRQLNFCLNVNEDFGTEMRNLIDCAGNLKYITHKNLELNYDSPKQDFDKINKAFYEEIWFKVRLATGEQSKLKFITSYNNCEHIQTKSLSLKHNTLFQQMATQYHLHTTSKLGKENGREYQETNDFLSNGMNKMKSHNFNNIRQEYHDFPPRKHLFSFFHWEPGALVSMDNGN